MDPFSSGELLTAVSSLGREPEARRRLIAALRDIEAWYAGKEMEGDDFEENVNVREFITGPIVDAMFQKNELLTKELANGFKFSFRYSSKIARDFVMGAERPDHVWEPQTTKLLCMLAPTARTAVVAGAYFGDQALLLASAMQDKSARCYCFEVNETQIGLLTKNARANGVEAIVPVQKALWDRSNMRLSMVGEDSHASLEEGGGDGAGYVTVALDDFGRENGIDSIQLLMIDIEGAELSALRGARSYLGQPADRAPSIVFEIHRSYVDWSNGLENTDIVRYLEGFGYELYAIRDYHGNVDMRGRPIEIVPIRKTFLASRPHGFNALAIKDRSIIERLSLRVVESVSPKLLIHRDPKLHHPLS
jgi:FkbM family methyltransferase